jgi:pyruvate dehydrogenase kinase 2/3/4
MLLQVSDQGGGIPRSQTDLLFNYMFSTAPQPPKSDAHTAPLAGRYPVSLPYLIAIVLVVPAGVKGVFCKG